MADSIKPPSPVSPMEPSEGKESPTTARPLEFDSDQDGDSQAHTASKANNAPKPPPKDEAPPPKPPRPVSQREQNEATLREAFPSIDASVVKAVLAASGGQVEPAFNALLGMSDPDSQNEPEPPARPPRPQQPLAQPQNQVDADEMYARQLQEHYASTGGERGQRRQPNDRYNGDLQGSRPGRPGANPNPDDVPWRSFFDDDLPEIRDNIKKGFFETQSTVNKWITTFKKKIDGEDDENDFTSQPARPAQNYGQQPYTRQSNDMTRRSAEMQRYDADPQLIGDDFSKLELRDGDAPPRMSSRPLANPNLFRPTSALARKSSSPGSGRKVSFQPGPPEEIRDMYSGSPKPATTANQIQQPTSTTKSSKWQPLSAVEPSPVTDNDPFSLGDSDDEKDAKPITLTEDDEEDAQVKKTTNEAMSDAIGGDTKATSPIEAKKG